MMHEPAITRSDVGQGIVISGLQKSFQNLRVFNSIDLLIEPGQFVCLLGPSGCGKTTLLRCLAGLAKPDGGRIEIAGQVVFEGAGDVFVPPERRGLGMVFQQYALWPHMTVSKNIAYPLERKKVPPADRERRVHDVARLVGIDAMLSRHPSQISGGQQQRVALARALVNEPPVLLLDEPLSNLDASLRAQLRRELRQLHERLGMTTVLVTHDQEEAAAVADVVVVMLNGAILQTGAYEDIMRNPRNGFVAKFVGYDNLMPASDVSSADGTTRLVAADGSVLGFDRATDVSGVPMAIALRADALRLTPATAPRPENTVTATIKRITSLGHSREIELESNGFAFVSRMKTAEAPDALPGDTVFVEIPGQSPIVPAN